MHSHKIKRLSIPSLSHAWFWRQFTFACTTRSRQHDLQFSIFFGTSLRFFFNLHDTTMKFRTRTRNFIHPEWKLQWLVWEKNFVWISGKQMQRNNWRWNKLSCSRMKVTLVSSKQPPSNFIEKRLNIIWGNKCEGWTCWPDHGFLSI